jgi:hypothetical protein
MTTTTTITTRLALAAAAAALCFGAAACGDETTTASPAASLNQAGPQQQSRTSPRAAEQQDLAERQRAERADAQRWARGHQTTEHPPGSFHADTQCRRQRRSSNGLINCTSTPPSESPTAPRPGSPRFPDLLP